MREFIRVDEARRTVLFAADPIGAETVRLAEALGRTLSETIIAEAAIPPFDNSAMDGYALQYDDTVDTPVVLKVIGEVAAGSWPQTPVRSGECLRIMTGAPIPPGCDRVVPQEWTEILSAKEIRLNRAPPPAYAIRRAGEDVERGESILSAGTLVTPPVVGMLASLGKSTCSVSRRPSVSIVATGSEIVPVESVPAPGQIRNSNGPAIAAQVVSAGGSVEMEQIAADDIDGLESVVGAAMNADIVVLSGGVSVGAYDLVQEVLRSIGVDLRFWKVRQRPGKPLLFGVAGAALVFGLPGNPVSASICFDQYVRPAIQKMLGRSTPDREKLEALLTEPIKKLPELQYFARGICESRSSQTIVRPAGPQGSGVYSALVRANCIIHLPEGLEDPPAGTTVTVEPFSW